MPWKLGWPAFRGRLRGRNRRDRQQYNAIKCVPKKQPVDQYQEFTLGVAAWFTFTSQQAETTGK
jgi:hypothetical protein